MKEIFKSVPNLESKYMISNMGRIYSLKTKKFLNYTHKIDGSGYYTVGFMNNDGTRKYWHVHRLLAEVFIPNSNNLRTVNHINGNKLDNRLENLEWADDCYQQHQACLLGLKPHTKHILTEEEIVEVYKKYSEGRTIYSLAKEYNTRKQQISKLLKGQRHKKLFRQYQAIYNLKEII